MTYLYFARFVFLFLLAALALSFFGAVQWRQFRGGGGK
jgi:hypothetical protein